MISGFNHNIPYAGRIFHVQTELARAGEPRLATHVFLKGRVIACEQTGCADLMVDGVPSPELRPRMKEQQKEMIRQLISGKLHPGGPPNPHAETPPPVERRGSELPWKNRWREVIESVEGSGACSDIDLSVRRSIVRLRRAVAPKDPPARDRLSVRLKRISSSLAVLVGKNLGDLLREEELADLLMLRSEAMAWSREGAEAPFATGFEVWRSFAELSERLMQINSREKILRRDHQILTEVSRRLFEPANRPETVGDATYDLLRSVFGRDEEIDDLLERPQPVLFVRTWQAPVRRVMQELGSRLAGELVLDIH